MTVASYLIWVAGAFCAGVIGSFGGALLAQSVVRGLSPHRPEKPTRPPGRRL